MRTNEIPTFDASDNETNCCPRFHPGPWDGQALHFDNKLFVKASTVAAFHGPLNMGSVWCDAMKTYVDEQRKRLDTLSVFYPICPKGSKALRQELCRGRCEGHVSDELRAQIAR